MGMSLLKWLGVGAGARQLVAYTDGASPGNGKADCRGGVGVAWPEHPDRNVSEPLAAPPRPTNNRAELAALIRALEVADAIDPGRRRPLLIKSDSMLCVQAANVWMKSWKSAGWLKADKAPPKNLDLLKRLDALMRLRRTRVEHVAAHTGRSDPDSVLNALADRLAVKGAA